eukprot:scaffold716_cov104-Isochrysis_galbana.AAC.1
MMRAMAKGAPDAPQEGGVSQSPIGKDFAALTQQLHQIGCFEPHYADEALKLVVTLLPGLRLAGARELPGGLQLLHERLDLARLPAPRRHQGELAPHGALEQRGRVRHRRLAGLRRRLVARTTQHAPPGDQRARQRPRHHDSPGAGLRPEQPKDRRRPERGTAVAAVVLRAGHVADGRLLAVRIGAVPGSPAAGKDVGVVAPARGALRGAAHAVPRPARLAALHAVGARLPDGTGRLLDALRRGHPRRRAARDDAGGADGAHLAQHHGRLPGQPAHRLHLAPDRAPLVADDADGPPREGPAALPRLLQEARAALPRVQPVRVRQVQHQGARVPLGAPQGRLSAGDVAAVRRRLRWHRGPSAGIRAALRTGVLSPILRCGGGRGRGRSSGRERARQRAGAPRSTRRHCRCAATRHATATVLYSRGPRGGGRVKTLSKVEVCAHPRLRLTNAAAPPGAGAREHATPRPRDQRQQPAGARPTAK